MTPTRRVLIVAGGTGGHIIPGLSVADMLRAKGWQVEWAGNPNAMEGKLVPQKGIKLNTLVFSGFRGKGIFEQLLIPVKLLRAFWTSIQIIRAYRPHVVLGMGGYVAFPIGMMASLFNKPLVIHEQNSIAGLTNRVLAKLADRNLVAFPNALHGASWVGNPLREDIIHQPDPQTRYGNRQGNLKLLVLGGSLGAQALNSLVPAALAMIDPAQRPEVTHQSGEKHLADLVSAYSTAGVQVNAVSFISEVAASMAQADLLICRAGAMTVAEVAAVGVSALFVPFPHAVDDHQTTNALWLVNEGAGWIRQQRELSAQWLADFLKQLSREQCMTVAVKARHLAKPKATAEVVAHIEEVALS